MKVKQLGFKVLNLILQAASFGREAIPGKLYRIKKPYMMHVLFLRPSPGDEGNKSICNRFSLSDKATLLVLRVETNKPIWDQWIQVLFTNSEDVTWAGWIPYHEFNRMVHAEWFNQWAD